MNDTNATAADEAVIGGQITEVKPDNALVVMDPEKYATELFAPFNAELAQAKRRANRQGYDITTKEGMATAKDLRSTFVKLRTRADKTKTEAKRPIDIAGKAILARFNAFRDAAEAEELKHAQAIDAETARREAEQAAKEAEQRAITEAIEARIAHIRGIPAMSASLDSAALALKVDELAGKQIDPNLYPGAYLNDAVEALNETVDKLREMHQMRLNHEAEQRRITTEREELAQLKAQQEARDKADREAAAERQRQADEQAKEIAALRAQLAAATKAAEPIPEPAPPVVAVSANVQATPATAHEIDTPMPGVLADEHQSDDTVELTERARPYLDDIINVLVVYYGEQPLTILGWLRDMVAKA